MQLGAELPGSCSPLPPVTVVFAEVADGKALVRQQPELALMVHTTLLGLLQVGMKLFVCSQGRLLAELPGFMLDRDGPAREPGCCKKTGMLASWQRRCAMWNRFVLSVCVHVCCCQVLLAALPEQDGQPAGYLCRQQEQCMRFMLAFSQPTRALEWCLMMQVRAAGCCGGSRLELQLQVSTH